MLTQTRLKEVLRYNPKTGKFYWKIAISFRVHVNKRAGTPAEGYRILGIDGVRYKEHRLAWLYVYGKFPAKQIDHINHNRADNRIANLREATNGQNAANSFARNSSGYKGVRRWRSKWAAQLTRNGKAVYLGCYPTPEDAHAAYCRAAKKLHGEFFNPG